MRAERPQDDIGNRVMVLSDRLEKLESKYTCDATLAYSYATSALHEINALARELELAGRSPDQILSMFARIRRSMASSPLGNHMQTWPSGHPGDFRVVEYIAAGKNRAEPNSFAFSLEQAMLDSGIVQQHRSKLRAQSEVFLGAICDSSFRPRILSVGCGGCRDLLPLSPLLRHFKGELVLNDIDPAALDFAADRIRPTTQNFRLVCANVLSVVRLLRKEEPFDLIVAGGLFDYIPDRLLRLVLRDLYRDVLASGGVLLFTNIDQGNPFRPLMTYAVDWKLMERSEKAIRNLCADALIPYQLAEFAHDDLQLTWLVKLHKPV